MEGSASELYEKEIDESGRLHEWLGLGIGVFQGKIILGTNLLKERSLTSFYVFLEHPIRFILCHVATLKTYQCHTFLSPCVASLFVFWTLCNFILTTESFHVLIFLTRWHKSVFERGRPRNSILRRVSLVRWEGYPWRLDVLSRCNSNNPKVHCTDVTSVRPFCER